MFVPVTQDGTTCGQGGCNSPTSGYLLPGKVPATWPGTVAVGGPFPVRTLIWITSNAELISGTIFATGRLLLWLLVTLLDLILIPVGIAKLRPARGRGPGWGVRGKPSRGNRVLGGCSPRFSRRGARRFSLIRERSDRRGRRCLGGGFCLPAAASVIGAGLCHGLF